MSGIVGAMNQPLIKQEIKNVVGAVTCSIGTIALYDVMRGKIYTKYARNPQENYSIVDQVTLVFAQISFALSAIVTPLGIWALSNIINQIFSSTQLENVFGPNTVFEADWKHPRHMVSLIAVGLALPLVLKRLFIPPIYEEERQLQHKAFFTIIFSQPNSPSRKPVSAEAF